MLFLLTGDVQIGKTRWLERLAVDLMAEGVEVAGVVAPGVWRRREPFEAVGEPGLAGVGEFEKLGIDNVLLPQGERVAFARRRDLALAEGTFDPTSQSAAAQLAWEISDDAIARVNAHFDTLRQVGTSRNESASASDDERCQALNGLVVVDELGRLELMRACGLTSAVALLDAGPTARFPHALVVVRDWLQGRAEERFAARWGGSEVLAPDNAARALVRAAYGLSSCIPY